MLTRQQIPIHKSLKFIAHRQEVRTGHSRQRGVNGLRVCFQHLFGKALRVQNRRETVSGVKIGTCPDLTFVLLFMNHTLFH